MEHQLAFALTGFAVLVGVSIVFFAVRYIHREMYSVHPQKVKNIWEQGYKDSAAINAEESARERSYTIP